MGNTRKLSIRLYRIHDIDLLTFYKNPDIDFKKTLLDTLENYATGNIYILSRRGSNYYINPDLLNSKYKIDITFNIAEYPHLYEMLKHIRPKWQNALIKNVLRMYLAGDGFYPCWSSEDYIDQSKLYQTKFESILETDDLIRKPVYRKSVQKKLELEERKKDRELRKQTSKEKIKNTLADLQEKSSFIKNTDTVGSLKELSTKVSSTDENTTFIEIIDNHNEEINKKVALNVDTVKVTEQTITTDEKQNQTNEAELTESNYDIFGDINSMLANF
jgi:hypothetical protein